MRKPYLVVYDYGQGGLWGYVVANSKAEIEASFHEVTVLDQKPDWMSEEERTSIEADSFEELEHPGSGVLGAVLTFRAEDAARAADESD
jgi:hypothetical protein